MVPRRPLPFVLYGLLTMAGVGLAACDKVPLVAPAGTVITLVSSTNVLPINGSTDLVAVLIENGTTSSGTGTGGTTTGSAGNAVHNGTLVTFTTSLGKIEPAEARTTNGRVTVKLTADGRSGKATITAFSGSAKQTLEVVIGAAAAERVLVTASPTSVPAIGGTTVVQARVEDLSGNPLLGVPVAFTTTAGTLTAVSGLTNDAGIATTSLSTNAAATVTATAGGKTGTAAITVRTAATVQLGLPTGSVTVGSPVTFTVTPSAGATLSNVVVNFGDGRSENLGTITSASSVAHYFEDEEIFLIRVTATDADGSPVQASSSIAVTGFNITASGSPSSGPLGTVVNLTVSGLPTNVPIDEVEWRFGNGVTRTTNSTGTTYEYPQRGTYTVIVIVHPVYGPSRTATISVSVF
jgi:Bacterial Ig-like domain (group 1)/PKD domain